MSLSRIAELEAVADNLRRENADLRAQLRRTSLLPPPLDDLPSPHDAVGAVEFSPLDACLPIANQEGA